MPLITQKSTHLARSLLIGLASTHEFVGDVMRGAVWLGLALSICGPAHADEVMRTLAMNGDWVAGAHAPSALAAPDVCMAMNVKSKFMLRLDDTSFEVRLSDPAWSLPADATGALLIKAGAYEQVFPSGVLNSTLIAATIDPDDVAQLIDALGAADVASVTIGKEAARKVSLAGSAKVLNAFRTCGGIKGGATGGGSNPFK